MWPCRLNWISIHEKFFGYQKKILCSPSLKAGDLFVCVYLIIGMKKVYLLKMVHFGMLKGVFLVLFSTNE